MHSLAQDHVREVQKTLVLTAESSCTECGKGGNLPHTYDARSIIDYPSLHQQGSIMALPHHFATLIQFQQ